MLVPLTISVWRFNTRLKKIYIYIKEWNKNKSMKKVGRGVGEEQEKLEEPERAEARRRRTTTTRRTRRTRTRVIINNKLNNNNNNLSPKTKPLLIKTTFG